MRARFWPVWACIATLGVHATALAQSRFDGLPRSNLQNTFPRGPEMLPQPKGQAPNVPRSTRQEMRPETSIRPTEFRIAGVKSIPFAEVLALFKPYVNKDTTLGEVFKAVQQVKERYVHYGYALSYAYLPEQDFANGVVQVVAVEGYVNSLALKNAPPHLQEKVRAIADQIVGERPLTKRTFERYVSLLGRLPDVSVDANIPPPQGDDGASPLELAVRHRRFTASARFTTAHPGFQGLLTGNLNGVTSLGDRLSVSVMVPRGPLDRSYLEANYALPLGTNGLALHANAYRYRGRPRTVSVTGAPIRQDYSDERAALSLAYPFVLNGKSEVSGALGLFATRSGAVFTKAEQPGQIGQRASTRGLQASLLGNWQGNGAETGFEAQVVKGLSCCGADQGTGSNVDLAYTKVRLSARRSDQWRDGAFGTSIKAVVQHSKNILPVTERINFGNTYFGAGYNQGERLGDSGGAVAVEVNKLFQRDGTIQRIQPYLGMDYARTRLTGSTETDALRSAIVGVRVATREQFSIDINRARPLGAPPIGETDRSGRWNVQAAVKF